MNDSYYDLLGVPQDAQPEEIKKAYRSKILLCHPDKAEKLRQKAKGDPDLTSLAEKEIRRMELEAKLLNKAYSILSNAAKRKEYNHNLQEEEATSKPKITLKPHSLNFGEIEVGKSISKSFQVLNSGGPASTIHIDWSTVTSWGKDLVIDPNDPTNPTVIDVTVNISTKSTPIGSKRSTIDIIVDGISYKLPVNLVITPRYVPPPIPIATKAAPTPPPTTKSKVSVGKVILSFFLWHIWLIGIPVGIYMIKNGSLTKKEFALGLIVPTAIGITLMIGIQIFSPPSSWKYVDSYSDTESIYELTNNTSENFIITNVDNCTNGSDNVVVGPKSKMRFTCQPQGCINYSDTSLRWHQYCTQ